MPGFIYKGASSYSGSAFYLPEWYSKLYATVDGVAAAYMAGWMREPGAALIDGPTMRQMEYFGTGDDPVVADAAGLNGEPAFTFPDKLINTGHARSEDFTLLALVEFNAEVQSGPINVIMHANGGAPGDLQFQVAPGGFPALQIATNQFIGGGVVGQTSGAHVVAATCRNTGVNTWLLKTFSDGFVTPLATATRTTPSTLGASWVVGGHRTNVGQIWRAPLLGWVIFDRDMSENAADAAALHTAMIEAKAWMS